PFEFEHCSFRASNRSKRTALIEPPSVSDGLAMNPSRGTTAVAFFALTWARVATANDNGLALSPPMGWRSWNQYGPNVSQALLMSVMDGMADRSRLDQSGTPTSLRDLGYKDVGLDDGWQHCNASAAAPGMHYHDAEGRPIVDETKFPDLKSMTDYAHALNLTAGFYGNNCICSDHCRNETECGMQTKADVKSFLEWGFDSWKLDGCGGQKDLALFDGYLQEMSPDKPTLVENCHWGRSSNPDPQLPPREGCPFNYYRSSGDIGGSYASVLANLASVEKYRAAGSSIPGCWAYPDMLQVGVRDKKTGEIALTDAEARSHFGAWCIVSSPLILGHDVHDAEVKEEIWGIVSNREAIAVNQAYYGDSGGVYEKSQEMICLDKGDVDLFGAQRIERGLKSQSRNDCATNAPSYQYLSKPLSKGKVAVLLMNASDKATMLTAKFSDIPGLPCAGEEYSVWNIWTHSYKGEHLKVSWSARVGSHDSAFIILVCSDLVAIA
ncbi:hypothetical protein ACHAWF_017096, partial [Thalassiosira exigua]